MEAQERYSQRERKEHPIVLSLQAPTSLHLWYTKLITVRKLRAIDPAVFKRYIIDSDLFLHPSGNLEELVLQFHDTCEHCWIVMHAPDKRKKIRARPSAP